VNIEPKYKVGDVVWIGRFDPYETQQIVCPDCGGTKHIHIALWNGEEFNIECKGCALGYAPPRGFIEVYTQRAYAEKDKITGLEVSSKEIRYHFEHWDRHYVYESEYVFDNEEEAQKCAEKRAAIYEKEDLARNLAKTKDHRSWAWHVHYHRKNIKEAQRQIDRSTEALNYAKSKAKGDTE
jgi:hypothetical protein